MNYELIDTWMSTTKPLDCGYVTEWLKVYWLKGDQVRSCELNGPLQAQRMLQFCLLETPWSVHDPCFLDLSIFGELSKLQKHWDIPNIMKKNDSSNHHTNIKYLHKCQEFLSHPTAKAKQQARLSWAVVMLLRLLFRCRNFCYGWCGKPEPSWLIHSHLQLWV